MTLWVSGNLSQRRSLDPTEGNRGKNARVNCFMCPRMAMLPYLDDAKHFWKTAPADFEFPAVHQNSLWSGKTTLSQTDSLTLPQLCQNYMPLCVRIGKIDRLRRPLNA